MAEKSQNHLSIDTIISILSGLSQVRQAVRIATSVEPFVKAYKSIKVHIDTST